jgi:hypothetical protein
MPIFYKGGIDVNQAFRKLAEEAKAEMDRFSSTPAPKEEFDIRKFSKGVNRLDPMSPYTPPKSKLYFENITDVIRNKQFSGVYPQSYGPMANYFKEFGITPYFEQEDFIDYARGALTIERMIDLTVNGKSWKLDREQDLYLVREIANAYNDQLSHHALADDMQIQAYKKKVEIFLRKINAAISKIEHALGRSDSSMSIIDKITGMDTHGLFESLFGSKK